MSDQVGKIISRMTLEQKIGQKLVFGFSGVYPHRDTVEVIEKYHVAGFRVSPHWRKFVRYFGADHPGAKRVLRDPEPNERVYGATEYRYAYTVAEYARVLNTLRQRSLETGAGIPIHFSTDFEGNTSADLLAPGVVGFPHPMGLAASGDPSLCRRVARVIATQLKAVGIDWIQSPVLDVNTNPANPEIGTRSYSPDPKVLTKYAVESLRGFTEGNIAATGKHFPGRGASDLDAHFDVAVLNESADRMREVHLAPYRALIAEGLPAIMLAHSIFPALDPEKEVATVSRAIVTDVLRGELGFDGVVITDSFTMGGLVARYEVQEAAIRAVEAGVDVILLKDDNALRGEVFYGLVDAVKSGRIGERRVEESVARVLRIKERCGLLSGKKGIVDPEKAQEVLRNPFHAETEKEAAAKSLVVLRDRDGLLPLRPGVRVLVAEEVSDFLARSGSAVAHAGALYEALLEQGVDAFYADFDMPHFDSGLRIVAQRSQRADLLICTAYYTRNVPDVRHLRRHLLALGKPTIFVTNSPYAEVVLPEMHTVLVTFSQFTASMAAAADVITGKTRRKTALPFDPERMY